MKNSINIQDQFLNQVRRDRVPVVIRLLDETELSGVVRSFDNFCIQLDSDESHLVYKHAIATVFLKKK